MTHNDDELTTITMIHLVTNDNSCGFSEGSRTTLLGSSSPGSLTEGVSLSVAPLEDVEVRMDIPQGANEEQKKGVGR